MARNISGNPWVFDAATQGEGTGTDYLLHGTWTINASTDVATMTGHGFTTGNGPVRLTNSGGGLPTGLSTGTDYWIIRIDADTFYFAASYDDAIAGTYVNVSSAGTGTHSLKMLPLYNHDLTVEHIKINTGAGGALLVSDEKGGRALADLPSASANDAVEVPIGGRVKGIYVTTLPASAKVYVFLES